MSSPNLHYIESVSSLSGCGRFKKERAHVDTGRLISRQSNNVNDPLPLTTINEPSELDYLYGQPSESTIWTGALGD